jgi:hypothetical protein
MVVVMVAACTSSSAPVATVSPTPRASASPTSVSSSAGPSPVGSSPGVLSLNCRLPVTWAVQSGQTVITKAGFVTFPNQTLLEDPSAPEHSAFYDRAFSKWLPVWRASVSPDGARYAYSEGNAYQNTGGKLHVVNVATGVDRVIYGGGTVYGVVDFSADGIYVTAAAPEGYPRGLWLEDPAGGPARLISSTIVAPAVGGGAAWGLDFNAADPSPAPGGMEGPMNRILRIDLRSGVATPWFYRPGANVYVLGFDSYGHPFVRADIAPAPTETNGRDTLEVWLVASNTGATKLFAGTGLPSVSRLAAVDSHGVWFDDSNGAAGTVWLYAAGSIQMVATINVDSFAVAGGCIP